MKTQELKHIRIDQKKSLTSLSLKTGISRQLISRIERDTGNPEFKTVVKLAAELGYDVVLQLKTTKI